MRHVLSSVGKGKDVIERMLPHQYYHRRSTQQRNFHVLYIVVMHVLRSDDDVLLLATFYAHMTDFDAVFRHGVQVVGYADLYKSCTFPTDPTY